MATLGKRYRDKVTGFEGVAVSEHTYLQGCSRISLERLADTGDKIISLCFDEPNLEALVGGPVAVRADGPKTGGPHDHETTLDQH